MKHLLWIASLGVGLGLGALTASGCGDECGGCGLPPVCGEPADPCSCGCGTMANLPPTCTIEDGVHLIVVCDPQQNCMLHTPCEGGLVCADETGVATCVDP